MADRTTPIGSKSLLAALPVEFSARLRRGGPTTVLRKGQALYEVGASGDGCYWINEGVLKVSVASKQGAERILAIRGPGTLVGVFSMIDGLPRSVSMYALRDSNMTFITRRIFLECLNGSPSLYPYLVGMLVTQLRHADEEVAAASFLSLRARVARALLKFAEHLGEPTGMPDQLAIRELRQEDVAALADVARENVSRILSEWKRHNLIVQQTPSVFVILKSKLEREAGVASIDSCLNPS
jgi:CRP/FNR family cyclic AMP-dependent transcriptional regulator